MNLRRMFAVCALFASFAMLPSSPASNAADDPSWLFDPLQVTQIDLEASQTALAQLAAAPTEYVDARITLRNGATTYGPYQVGLKLKGHSTFRQLDGKSAFKVKFGFSVSGQKFQGLKGLTLNNMTQDPSMIAEATSSIFLRAVGVPTARVGYAYVRLNGADYGLYADVETVDSVLAKRWFPSMQHIYEANYANDVVPGMSGDFDVTEGSATDRSDLEALAAADAGDTGSWSERVQPVADLAEMARAWAGEHYVAQWDGYSVGSFPAQPNNYYLASDTAGRFSMILTGTDQTWLERPAFGLFGNGLMMRHCVAEATCQQLYVDALRQIAANPVLASLADQARAIRAVVAPWRALDPRKEQTVAEGEAQADAKIATVAARPGELAAWLERPSFVENPRPIVPVVGGTRDLSVTGTVTPDSAPVGGSYVWRLQVKNSGDGIAPGVVLDVQLSPNQAYGFGEAARGTGCTPTGAGVRCNLDSLGPPADSATSTNDVAIGTNVTGGGEVSLTATVSYSDADARPDDNTLVLTANVPAGSSGGGGSSPAAVEAPTSPVAEQPAVTKREPLAQTVVVPVLGKPVVAPAKPAAGHTFTLSLPVTRSDTGAPLLAGTLVCNPSIAGRIVAHTDSFRAGKVHLSLSVPKTAKGKTVKVEIRVTTSGRTAARIVTYAVR